MIQYCSFKSIDIVLSTWEIARQQESCEEELGINFLIALFAAYPQTKRIFGFAPNQDVANNPLLRIGVLVHARRVIDLFNDLISMIGPDLEDLEGTLVELACVLAKSNIDPKNVKDASMTIKETLSGCFGNRWDQQYDEAWDELLSKVSDLVVSFM